MSMISRPASGADLGEVVASTRDYEVAQKTVSKLIAGEVPARNIAIVGQGVRTVEKVTGKLGYASAARSGAINGVLIGLVLSAIMLFGNPDAPISLFLGFILVGVALGMIMSLVTYSIVRRRRDFASVTQMLADHYEVRVQSASLSKAREVMGTGRTAAPRPDVDLSTPPQYGERLPAPGAEPGADVMDSQRSTEHAGADPVDRSADFRSSERDSDEESSGGSIGAQSGDVDGTVAVPENVADSSASGNDSSDDGNAPASR